MKSLELLNRLKQLELQTQTALFSYNQAKVLFADENEKSMYIALGRHAKNGVIERVCKGVWLNSMSRYANSDTRLEELALLLRPDHYSYVSMETVLSQASIISQQMFGYLTVMTTGSSKIIKATFGTLEFTHTKRDLIELSRHSVPEGHKLPWANIDTAYRDLKRSGRNVNMIDMELLKRSLDATSKSIKGKSLMSSSKIVLKSNSSSKSNLLREMVKTACASQELAGMETTVEKELLHYDIMAALSQSGLLAKLVFQGGTCLRMAYGSQRLSEDLGFVGGVDFTPEAYQYLAQVLIDYFKPRYGLDIRVKTPKDRTFNAGSVDVGRWMVSIETQPQAKDLPNQKIKLEVANIPSYSSSTKAIKLNYPALQSGLSTVLVNCETEEEILADKIVALCLRKFIKARDLWDLVMLEQQGLKVNDEWTFAKFKDYLPNKCQRVEEPQKYLQQRLIELPDYWESGDFENEMRRFLPRKKIQETFEQANFMAYFTDTINTLLNKTIARWENPSASNDGTGFQL